MFALRSSFLVSVLVWLECRTSEWNWAGAAQHAARYLIFFFRPVFFFSSQALRLWLTSSNTRTTVHRSHAAPALGPADRTKTWPKHLVWALTVISCHHSWLLPVTCPQQYTSVSLTRGAGFTRSYCNPVVWLTFEQSERDESWLIREAVCHVGAVSEYLWFVVSIGGLCETLSSRKVLDGNGEVVSPWQEVCLSLRLPWILDSQSTDQSTENQSAVVLITEWSWWERTQETG